MGALLGHVEREKGKTRKKASKDHPTRSLEVNGTHRYFAFVCLSLGYLRLWGRAQLFKISRLP